MRRLRWKRADIGRTEERGAAGVVVALMMLVLIGAGAMAVDVGQIYAERAQLQNGADAGALAVAKSCEIQPCTPSLAGPLANANSNDGASDATVDVSVKGRVTVTTSTRDGSASFLAKMFASALSAAPVTVTAVSTAAYGGPSVGPASLPLTFAPCQFDFSGTTIAMFSKGKDKNCVGDSSASGQVIPGGFEWIDTIAGKCAATVYPPNPKNSNPDLPYVTTDTGANLDSDCNGKKGDNMADFVGHEVLIPVFSGLVGNGSGGIYYIEGFAAFHLDGFVFPGHCAGTFSLVADKCGGSLNGIQGHFVKFVADPSLYTGGGYTDGGTTLPPQLIK